jgi:hypothetical protein
MLHEPRRRGSWLIFDVRQENRAVLDLKHPQTRWIMAASREEDAILRYIKLMTLLPTSKREQLLSRVARPISRLQLFGLRFEDYRSG